MSKKYQNKFLSIFPLWHSYGVPYSLSVLLYSYMVFEMKISTKPVILTIKILSRNPFKVTISETKQNVYNRYKNEGVVWLPKRQNSNKNRCMEKKSEITKILNSKENSKRKVPNQMTKSKAQTHQTNG